MRVRTDQVHQIESIWPIDRKSFLLSPCYRRYRWFLWNFPNLIRIYLVTKFSRMTCKSFGRHFFAIYRFYFCRRIQTNWHNWLRKVGTHKIQCIFRIVIWIQISMQIPIILSHCLRVFQCGRSTQMKRYLLGVGHRHHTKRLQCYRNRLVNFDPNNCSSWPNCRVVSPLYGKSKIVCISIKLFRVIHICIFLLLPLLINARY